MIVFAAVPAYAVPGATLDQARSVKAEIDRLDKKVEVAAERYNEAKAKHNKLIAEKNSAAKKLKKTQARMDVVQTHLSTRANNMYRQGPTGFLDVLLGAQSFEEFATTWDLLKGLNQSDAASVSELKQLRAEVRAAHKDLAAKERAAAVQVAVMKKNKESIQAQLAQRKAKLSGLEAQIAALEAAEERARAARAPRFVRSNGGGKKFPPPTRAARSEVVSIAKRYLGAPYVWGAAGPNSFDCSGFTMFVYRQVGVSLPHSSRAQIGCGQRVSRSDLAPGDLVFFGSPIHHVGIYVGGGMYIHAPHTGDVVKISALDRGDYAGACRP